ncbi:MAG: glycosyltransferase family 2 protein [Lachnospiraceae bacterium]|nr:glycosyltransferase family 2 protein [Lachnospiraceae bacterium]
MSDSQERNLEQYYKALYEKEQKKNEELLRDLVRAEEENAELKRKVDQVKNSILFKLIKPVRNLWARLKNGVIRIKRYGSIKGVYAKLKSKRIERAACKYHGTLSFPDEAERERQRAAVFKDHHVVSILVPLFNTPEKFLREMIESVTAQTYEGWQLCLADGSDEEHPEVGSIVKEYMEKDAAEHGGKSRIAYRKIKNQGISGNTNECFAMAEGDYYGLCDHDDVLHPSVLYYYMKEIEETDADFLYCDEATFKDGDINKMITLHFKPEFAIDNLCANNYICHFSVFKKSLSEEAGLFRPEFDGAQDHDMILRLTAGAGCIRHVPHILYYWRSHALSTAADINAKTYAIKAAKGAVASYLSSKGFRDFEIESTKAFATIFRIRYALTGKPKISIIIPSSDHCPDLRRCIDSVLTRSSYENYEILVIENNSREKETEEYYKELEEIPVVRLLRYVPDENGGGFNFSKLINFGAAKASGEVLLLLNNDTEVITRSWMEELLMFVQREDVGAVGAKLYYEDYTIQHAGIVLGMGAHRTAGHSHYGLSKDNLGYMGRLMYAQDVSAVTGACLMVSKKDFEEAGGFDESFAVALNDVDFCLKLRELGKLNVFTPFAELFHYESRSRGSDVNGEDKERSERYDREAERFREKWRTVLEAGDPYFNPNFSLDYSNYTLGNAANGSMAMVKD